MTRPSPEAADPVAETDGTDGGAGTDGAEADGGAGADGSAAVLRHMREQVLRLLEEIPRPPRTLRVRAGDVAVDVEWEAAPPNGNGAAPAAAAAEAEPSAPPEAGAYVHAPTVGVFYRAPEPGADPFVAEGDTVTPGQQVGIVEAMKMMIPVEAGQAGRITEILKENGDSVEYGERLLALEPEGAP